MHRRHSHTPRARTRNRQEWVPIVVHTPLPMAVAGALTDLIGAAWPSAVIDVSGEHVPSGTDALVLLVDPELEPTPVPRGAAASIADAARDLDGSQPAMFSRFETDGTIAMTPPEDLRLHLAEIADRIMRASTAPNYLEWRVGRGDASADDPTGYVISISRGEGRTPHELRGQTEAELAQLQRQVLALADSLDGDAPTVGAVVAADLRALVT